jgi:16S rRNA G966 N2-methylase RsmD
MKYPSDRKLFIHGVENGYLRFPYKRYFTSDKEIYEMFSKLENYSYKSRLMHVKKYSLNNVGISPRFRGKFVILLNKESDYGDFNQLSDMFQEECRIKCKLSGEMSPYEFFRAYPERIFDYCIDKYKEITVPNIRETIYDLIKECTSFRPTNIVAIIQMFKSTHILDFSAGWGDRLIGALAANVDFYCGIDPNECLHPNYKKIIEFFNKSENNFKMIKGSFQTVIIPKKPYDLVFTCPPYFDFEIYTGAKSQSISEYEHMENWYQHFLKFSVQKSWNCLISGGHFVLVLNQKRGQNYVERIVNYITTKLNSTYLGVISYSDEKLKNPQPMWIWKKE